MLSTLYTQKLKLTLVQLNCREIRINVNSHQVANKTNKNRIYRRDHQRRKKKKEQIYDTRSDRNEQLNFYDENIYSEHILPVSLGVKKSTKAFIRKVSWKSVVAKGCTPQSNYVQANIYMLPRITPSSS